LQAQAGKDKQSVRNSQAPLRLSFYQKFIGKSAKHFYRFTGKMGSVYFGKYQSHNNKEIDLGKKIDFLLFSLANSKGNQSLGKLAQEIILT
jgi:hypothetical protein